LPLFAAKFHDKSRPIQSRLNVLGGPGPARLMGPHGVGWAPCSLYQRIQQCTVSLS